MTDDAHKRTPIWTDAATIQTNGYWDGKTAQPDALKIAREALEGWRTIYQLAPPHPDIAPDIWQGMIDRTAAALKESK